MDVKLFENAIKVIESSDGKLSAIASDATVDRDGEIILPSAFSKHLSRYQANPVILAAHTHRSYDGMPTIIGSASSVAADETTLSFEMTFAKTDLAKQWQILYDDGHARAFSVGFIPIKGEWKESPPDQSGSIYIHTEVELLEISAVAVPANPSATVRGIDPGDLDKLIEQHIQKILDKDRIRRLSAMLDGV